MKNDSFGIKAVIMALVLVLLMVVYSLWSYFIDDSFVQVETNHEIEGHLSNLTTGIEIKFRTQTVLDPDIKIDSSAQHILFIGDSMAEGLQLPMQKYAKFNGHQLTTLAKRSATIMSWVGRNDQGRLRDTIEKVKPSYVIICLGSNELFTRSLNAYRRYMQNIIRQSQPIRLIWICPPNWKDDNGLTDLIENEIGTQRFFPSKKLELPRAGDGIHPTFKSYHIWADSIAAWVMYKSKHKILMLKPEEKSAENQGDMALADGQ